MKLGEALTLRSDVQRRISELRTRIKDGARVQEGEAPPEDPNALLEEFRRLADELEALVRGINRTNLEARIADGRTLTDALARRDSLKLRHDVLRGVAEAAAERHDRYSRSEIKMVRVVDVAALRSEADELARERRTLDALLQETNWANDLLDD
jgi:hypothetical protein